MSNVSSHVYDQLVCVQLLNHEAWECPGTVYLPETQICHSKPAPRYQSNTRIMP